MSRRRALLLSFLFLILSWTTTAEPPSGAPVDVAARPISSTSVHVTWSDVPADERNGVLQEYEVRYEQRTFMEVPQTGSVRVAAELEDAVTVGGLEEYVEYNVSVRASNEDGYGPLSPPVNNVTTYQDVPSSPPLNLSLSANIPSRLTISWTRPPEISINGVLTFYSLRYHQIGVDDFVFETADADLESTSLDQLHNHTLYEVFIAATTINGTGPFASQTAQTSENVPEAPPQNVTASSITPYTIDIEWRPPHQSQWNGILRGYLILYTETDSTCTSVKPLGPWSKVHVSPAGQTNYTIHQLQPSTIYCLQVSAVTVGPGPYSQPLYISTLDPTSSASGSGGNNDDSTTGSGDIMNGNTTTSPYNETVTRRGRDTSAAVIAGSVVSALVLATLVGLTSVLTVVSVVRQRRFRKSKSLVHYFTATTTTARHRHHEADTDDGLTPTGSLVFINPTSDTFELLAIGPDHQPPPLPPLPCTPNGLSPTITSGEEDDATTMSPWVHNPQYGQFPSQQEADGGGGVARGGRRRAVSTEVSESDYDYPASFRTPLVDNTGSYSTVATDSGQNREPPYATVS